MILFMVLMSILLVLGSAFFSSIEMAYISYDESKVAKKDRPDEKVMKQLHYILKKRASFITFVLLGNNFTLILLSAFVTMTFERIFQNWASETVELAVVLFLTPVIIIFCEILPKNTGYRNAQLIAHKLTSSIHFLMWIFMPLLRLLMIVSDFLIKPFMLFKAHKSGIVSRFELLSIFQKSVKEGSSAHYNKRLIQHVFNFSQTKVSEIMTPIQKVVSVKRNTSLEAIKKIAKENKFSRFVVRDDKDGKYLGFVNIYDILRDQEQHSKVEHFLRTPIFIKGEVTLQHALDNLKKNESWFLFVLDEYEHVIGTLTLKQLLDF